MKTTEEAVKVLAIPEGRTLVRYGAFLPPGLLFALQGELDMVFMEPVENKQYIDFYKSYKGDGSPKILDNGLIENGGEPFPHEFLLDYAEAIRADIIIAPDKLGNWQYNYYHAKIMARYWATGICLAGPDFVQQGASVATEANMPLICLPYRLNRVPIAAGAAKMVHLLGYKHPEQYAPYISANGPISIDTVEPISAAANKWSYADQRFASFPRPANYMELDPTSISIELCISNIRWFKKKLQDISHG